MKRILFALTVLSFLGLGACSHFGHHKGCSMNEGGMSGCKECKDAKAGEKAKEECEDCKKK